MRDIDVHPNEPDVRVFDVPEAGVLTRTETLFLSQTREPASSEWRTPTLVLRHYAFADEWFKINATFDLEGDLIETGPDGQEYVVNCDIATPLVWCGPDATSVDLFLDVLVRRDGTYRIVDRPEFDDACSRQLISRSEAEQAEAGLKSLLHWITSGRLLELVHVLPRYLAQQAPAPLPSSRAPLSDFHSCAPGRRQTWCWAPSGHGPPWGGGLSPSPPEPSERRITGHDYLARMSSRPTMPPCAAPRS